MYILFHKDNDESSCLNQSYIEHIRRFGGLALLPRPQHAHWSFHSNAHTTSWFLVQILFTLYLCVRSLVKTYFKFACLFSDKLMADFTLS